MTSQPEDPILDADLDAYVDGELQPGRRIQVEEYLSRNPNVAARVMADLRMRDELRLTLSPQQDAPQERTLLAARKLESGLARPRQVQLLSRIAAGLVLFFAGWTINDQIDAHDFDGFEVSSEAQTGLDSPHTLRLGTQMGTSNDGVPNAYSLDRNQNGIPDGVAIDKDEDGKIDSYMLRTQESASKTPATHTADSEVIVSFDVNGDGSADFGTIDQDDDGTVDWFEVMSPKS